MQQKGIARTEPTDFHWCSVDETQGKNISLLESRTNTVRTS